jgi:hypothetical protein
MDWASGFSFTSSTWVDTETPLLDAQIGYPHFLQDHQSCVPISGCDDRLAPIDSSGSLPLESNPDLHSLHSQLAKLPYLPNAHIYVTDIFSQACIITQYTEQLILNQMLC